MTGGVTGMGTLSDAQRAALTERLRRGRAARPVEATRGAVGIIDLTGAGDRPFFLVHAIGGTVFGYARLAREVGGAYRVHGIQADGPGSASADLDAVAGRYMAGLRAVQPTGPYRLGGWSMGGMVAFEIARRLTAAGERVGLLALLDAPSRMPPAPDVTESELTAFFVGETARTLGWDAEVAAIESDPEADHLGWLVTRLAAGGGKGQAVRAEIERRLTAFCSHHKMIAGYRPSGRLPAAGLVVETPGSADWAAEWAQLIDGPVRRVRVPGNHYTMLQPPSVRIIAEIICGWETP